jgi:hypothetical protein
MAAHGCVLVGEHSREMVGCTRNNDDFNFANYYFANDDKFDFAYYDDGCAAYGDNNNIYNDGIYDYDIDDDNDARHECANGNSCSNGCNIVVSIDKFHGYRE